MPRHLSILKLCSEAWRVCDFGARLQPAPCLQPAQKPAFSLQTFSKTDDSGLLAARTASRRASWRARRPPNGPPGALDGLPTGLLTPQTASDGPSPADKFTCRQDHLPTSPPADKSALAPSEPSTPALFCRSRRTAVTACLTRQPPDELSCMSTLLHVNLLPSHYATGSH